MKKFILIFDIPRSMNTLKSRVNRRLHDMEAEMLQHSVWRSSDLSSLSEIAVKIKEQGKAMIVEECLVVPYFSF